MNESTGLEFITIKVYAQTRRKLRLLSALTDKSMMVILENLVSRDLEKVQKQQKSEK